MAEILTLDDVLDATVLVGKILKKRGMWYTPSPKRTRPSGLLPASIRSTWQFSTSS